MKKPKKITVIALTIIGVILVGGTIAKNKMDSNMKEAMETKYEVAQVESGDLEVKISGSGTTILENEQSKNYNELQLQVEIDELDIDKIELNKSVDVYVDAYPDDTFKGYISEISQAGTSVNGVTTFMVKVSLNNPITQIASVDTDTTELKRGNSSDYTSIQTLNKDDEIEILEEEDSWYKVKTKDEVIGWLDSDDIEITGLKEEVIASITSDGVSLREGASSSDDTIHYLTREDKVEVINQDDSWYEVRLEDETTGWVYKDDIDAQPIKLGMNASIELIADKKEDTLYVPIEGINKNSDGDYVVVNPDTQEEKVVEVGIKNENYIEVVDGLSEGEDIQLSTVVKNAMPIPGMPFGK